MVGRWIAGGLVVAALAGGGWYYTRPAPIEVQLVKVQRGAVEATVNNTRAGAVKACHRAKLSAPAGGQIAQLLVKKGQRVQSGEVLLTLWNNDLQAQMQLAEQQLHTTQSRITEICTLATLSQSEAERSRELREKGFISAEGLERANANAQAKQAACHSARSEVAQSQSRINLAKAGLQRMVLRAPFDGIVADISGELGEYATPSPPGILTLPTIDLIDDRCLYVSAPIDEVDAAHIKIGQTSRITLDAIKGKTFAGKVKRIAPYVLELEKQARTVEVEVEFVTRPDAENLLVGYSADVEIVHTLHDKVLRIPTPTLLEGKRVLLYRADGILEERAVTTGLANWEFTEIISGLAENDQLVLSLDGEGVKAGAKVKPQAATGAVTK
ncbi:MAG: efflux RND transporter periplasmic adaptor subunit [Gallionella sp.]|nr:efflux RND transporter periplasmic adaptor subunit [Gallionella sp.]MDD4960170.1 efflux RND transporter periplasmic adaptor subunit [Gallionella sp.]